MTKKSADPRVDADMVERLIAAARSAAHHAYVPYSNFPVGAAILTADGTIVTGANIENASFGLTTCGERVAMFTAAAAGHREIRAIAISTPRHPGASPCGACRQVLNEFKPVDFDLAVMMDGPENVIVTSLDELLPMAFGPCDLS
jgi:cytidine deaminase